MNTRRPESNIRAPLAEQQKKIEAGLNASLTNPENAPRVLEEVSRQAEAQKQSLEKLLDTDLMNRNLDEIARGQVGLLKKKEATIWRKFTRVFKEVSEHVSDVLRGKPARVISEPDNKWSEAQLRQEEVNALAKINQEHEIKRAERLTPAIVAQERQQEIAPFQAIQQKYAKKYGNAPRVEQVVPGERIKSNQELAVDSEIQELDTADLIPIEDDVLELDDSDMIEIKETESIGLNSGGYSEIAKEHAEKNEANEDVVVVDHIAEAAMVGDGMGGYAAGEFASRLAAQQFKETVASPDSALGRKDLKTDADMEQARVAAVDYLLSTDKRIRNEADKDASKKGSLTTGLVTKFNSAKNKFIYGCVGDSMGLHWSGETGKLERFTKSGSAFESLVAQYDSTAPAAEGYRQTLKILGVDTKQLGERILWLIDNAKSKADFTYADGKPFSVEHQKIMECVFSSRVEGDPLGLEAKGIKDEKRRKVYYGVLRRNKVGAALGTGDLKIEEIDSGVRNVEPGDKILLLTDGFDNLALSEIEEFLNDNPELSPQETMKGLVALNKKAREAGGLRALDKTDDDTSGVIQDIPVDPANVPAFRVKVGKIKISEAEKLAGRHADRKVAPEIGAVSVPELHLSELEISKLVKELDKLSVDQAKQYSPEQRQALAAFINRKAVAAADGDPRLFDIIGLTPAEMSAFLSAQKNLSKAQEKLVNYWHLAQKLSDDTTEYEQMIKTKTASQDSRKAA